MIFADMILPIFTFPYLMVAAPWAIALAMCAEMIIFSLSKRRLGFLKIVSGTLGANALSWFFGILASLFIFGVFLGGFGMVSDPITEVRYLWWGILTAFFLAFLLSTLLEYFVWRWLAGWWQVSPTFASVALANAASYITLLTIFFFMNHRSLGS